ncbi:cation diffusion facilitator family transporter [Paenibacillus physcomitrellae]|uniref:Transporter YeaB n=1 Tax=Paenibacillus physcomitrellae TaxID=1619311 RepID=A0ABQ1G6E6_9BACL|nr:cation diffusion facilitator family transporter [Paenibacillus physcomitrellae]GGA37655.1 putative transporter YeaB [Paenibacillus physcomitrellae]
MQNSYDNLKQGEKGALLSIAVYLLLSAFKLIFGYYSHSEALQADGLNNATDIVASIAVFAGLKISRKPPDSDHRYGHYRAETIASLIASFIMFVVGLQVLYQAFMKFREPEAVSPDMTAAWVALLCAVIMYGVYRYNSRLARRVRSSALNAAAQDNRSDALVSIGAFAGIMGSQFGMAWLDPLAALVVGFIICRTAWLIFRDATHNLTDGFDAEQLEDIRHTVQRTPGVAAIIDLKARVNGNNTLVDATIGVDERMSVAESHAITEEIERRILDRYEIEYVHIHIEPYKLGERAAGRK